MTDTKREGECVHEHVDALDKPAEADNGETLQIGPLTEEEKADEKRLLRKIDLLIMPLVVAIYLINYIDRYVLGPGYQGMPSLPRCHV